MADKNPLQERYRSPEAVTALKEELGLKSVMQVPRLRKVIVNMGVAEAAKDKKLMDEPRDHLTRIAGQKPVVTRAKKSISNFKLREGQEIGCMVTLRGRKMFEFIERLTLLNLSRFQDFKGVKRKFDGNGNFSLGVKDQTNFIELPLVNRKQGLNITFVTNTSNDKHAEKLLEQLGMPFEKIETKKGAQ